MKKNIYVVVTDGQWHKSLSAVRSVGKCGYKTVVLGDSVFTTGFYSKYASKRKLVTEAKLDERLFHSGFQRVFQKLSADGKVVVIPMEIETLFYFAKPGICKKQGLYMTLPEISKIRLAENKALMLKTAVENGIPCPRTLFSHTFEQFTVNLSKVQKDFVVKPVHGSGSKGIIYVKNAKDIDFKKHWDSYGSLLIQERLPPDGKGVGVELLMNADHECVAFFSHERLKQYPNSGGPSTWCRSIYQEDLIIKSITLLKALQWVGVAMVEWKEDTCDGGYKFMEVNPRFWGSLELSSRCGINFPQLYVRQALGEKLPPCSIGKPHYKVGMECRWMFPGELLRYLTDKKRERIPEFLQGLPFLAEEWDKTDIRGFLASIVCPALLALHPKYWKYILKK